jgi:spore coat protein U-like protein
MSTSIKRNSRVGTLATAVALALGATGAVDAGTAGPVQFDVSVTVSANCIISSGSLGTFVTGTYDPVTANATVGSPLQATTTSVLKVTCTSGATTPVIRLDQGSHPAQSSTDASPSRRLSDGATHFLSYNLYKGGYTSVWGNTASTGLSYTGTGLSENIAVFAQIDGGQTVPTGTYTDTIQANIDF